MFWAVCVSTLTFMHILACVHTCMRTDTCMETLLHKSIKRKIGGLQLGAYILLALNPQSPIYTCTCTLIHNRCGISGLGEDYPYDAYILMLCYQQLEELFEVRSTEVGDGLQTSEETSVRDLLEIPLTDVLEEKIRLEVNHTSLSIRRTTGLL